MATDEKAEGSTVIVSGAPPPGIRATGTCDSCGLALLLSPASLALIETNKGTPRCFGCIDMNVVEHSLTLAPGQEEELLAEVGPEGLARAKALIESWNDQHRRSTN